MATYTYNVGSGYRLISGNLFQSNDLVINARSGEDENVSIASHNILGGNLPTTLYGYANGSRAFDAVLINKGVTFNGNSGNDTFDASGYIGDVKHNGFGGTNILKGATGKNVFTHDYANNGVDTIVGGADATVTWKLFFLKYSKTYKASNELAVNGTAGADDVFRFDGTDASFKVFKDDTNNHVIDASQFAGGKIVVKGETGNDHADVSAFSGVITFKGGEGDDTLTFKHGTSGAGTKFDGGNGNSDTLVVHAQNSGSTLAVDDDALSNPTTQLLVQLDSVEKVVFHGSSNIDTFDASAFTGKSELNGGDGADTLKASIGGSEITGGNGADLIHLGAGADRVVYDANGQSTVAQLDKVHGFDPSGDDLVFAYGNAVQANKTILQIPIIGSAIRFDNGVVEYRATQWSDWKTDLEDLSFGNLGITSLQKAAEAVALAAGDNRIAAFEYDENWYVIEAGSGTNVDNLIHLVGTTLNTSSNVNNFVDFLAA